MKRELDDQWHELFRNEVRKFRHRAREAEEASLENLKAMLVESDDVDEDEDARAADLEEELFS